MPLRGCVFVTGCVHIRSSKWLSSVSGSCLVSLRENLYSCVRRPAYPLFISPLRGTFWNQGKANYAWQRNHLINTSILTTARSHKEVITKRHTPLKKTVNKSRNLLIKPIFHTCPHTYNCRRRVPSQDTKICPCGIVASAWRSGACGICILGPWSPQCCRAIDWRQKEDAWKVARRRKRTIEQRPRLWGRHTLLPWWIKTSSNFATMDLACMEIIPRKVHKS